MKSYTTLRNLYGTLTKNVSTANLTFGDEIINDEIRSLCSMADWYFLHKTRTILSVAGQQFYNLPYDTDMVESVYVTVGGTRYVPEPVHSREQWDELNQTAYTSDFPVKFIVFDNQLGLWPAPVSASLPITLNVKVRVIDLSVADYTTGSIVSVANGGTAVVGTGTSWTNRMAGRYMRITYSDTANTGDGQWYEIATVNSTTSITLQRAYGGTSISAGTAPYRIGQMPALPEDFHAAPVFKAAATYWDKEADSERASKLMETYKVSVAILMTQRSGPVTNYVLDDGCGNEDDYINPNLTIHLTP